MKDYFPGNLGGNDRRFSRNNRTYDSTLTRNLDQRGGNHRNNNYQKRKNNQDAGGEALNENLTVIKEQLLTISGIQQRMAEAQERRANAEERNAGAMERIADGFLQLLNHKPGKTEEDPAVSETPEDHETPEDIPAVAKSSSAAELILNMRQNGISYDKIAENLIDNGVPTESGKGSWNRKMVSRIFQTST